MFIRNILEPAPRRCHVFGMAPYDPNSTDPRWNTVKPKPAPLINMTVTGEFIDGTRHDIPPIPAKIMGVAILVTVLAAAGAIALLALWFVLTLIPILLAAGLIAFTVFRVQLWFARRKSLGGQRNVFRP